MTGIESKAREFGPLVEECKQRGIGKSVAYELVKQGLLETFKLGKCRFVFIDSLQTLYLRADSYVSANARPSDEDEDEAQ